jgi:hypothetical protein
MEHLLRITDGAASWWKEIAISTHLRIAAGACVLSTGFMIGSAGGAVATADPEATGSSPSAGPVHGPIGTIADNVRKAVENSLQSTVQGVTGTLSTLAKPGQPQSTIPESPKTTFGGTPTVYGSTVPSATPEDATAAPVEASPASEPVVVSPASEPAVASPATEPTVGTPVPFAAPSGGMAPVSNAFTAVANTIFAVPGVVASLPTSVTPVSDVLTSIQNVLTSVGDAGTSLSQLPSDLIGLLGVSAPVPTPTIGASTGRPLPTSVTTPSTTAPVWSALPTLPALLGVDGGSALDVVPAPVAPLDVTTTGSISGASHSGSALITPIGDGKDDVLSTVEHVIGAVVATVSLTALAAMALPGILGLLTTCAAGIRVGYRQAKAASALPHTAISRFVGSGPIGVVRSSSQVEMRARARRVVRPAVRDAGRPRALRVVGSESSTTQLLDKAV